LKLFAERIAKAEERRRRLEARQEDSGEDGDQTSALLELMQRVQEDEAAATLPRIEQIAYWERRADEARERLAAAPTLMPRRGCASESTIGLIRQLEAEIAEDNLNDALTKLDKLQSNGWGDGHGKIPES
jgi:hypothetical protein